ncbi:MAG: putative ABC transporter permease subunit [Gemmataceae bacterium]
MNQALLFHRLRFQLLRNSWRATIGQSSMRPLTILLCSLVVWSFVFAISWGGFRFLRLEVGVPLTGEIVGILLDLLFLSLAVLLIFSSGLILYSSLFASAETAFLLSSPVAADRVFAYKFQGAAAFSSWAFLLLGLPILIAYGLACAASWYFYVLLPLFFLGFVLLPGSLGGLAALLIVNFFPRRRKQVLAVCLIALLLALAWWLYRALKSSPAELWRDEMREAVSRLLSYFHFTRNPLAPSHWVSLGLRRLARGEVGVSLYYLALIWCNGFFCYLIAAAASARLYRRGYNRATTGGDPLTRRKEEGGRRAASGSDGISAVAHACGSSSFREPWMDRLLYAVLFFVHPSTRLLLIKDFRTFRRDPQQWGQIVAFSGLMLLYFTNIHRFVEILAGPYQNSISFLNLCAVALLLCTYTGRFVYPMLSLEGRKFWILGLLPLEREQLLWGKFAFSLTCGLLIAAGLVLASDLMLMMPLLPILLHLLTVTVLSAGLSGLSVGLGACMPNFRESDPSKIAAGFGGTLNLVAGLLFLSVVLCLMAAPWHAEMMFVEVEEMPTPRAVGFVIVGLMLGLAVGAASVVLPLRAGIRALREMEF